MTRRPPGRRPPRRRNPGRRLLVAARSPRRRGSVLIVVLVVIVLLTYAVYGFTERMLAEAEAADAHGRAVQAAAFAESGVELAASLVASRAADPENPVSLYHQPTLFGGIVLRQSPTPSAVGRVSLIAPVEADATGRQVRFGLADESGKLNLNALAKLGLQPLEQQTILMGLPGMTEEIADAIFDFIDDDDDPRFAGVEADYYETLSPPYSPKNGPLDSVEELLLVKGVTPELLYGEDANRNGLLDPSEDDGADLPPADDADGGLNPGWAGLLTVHSRESNALPDGTKKLHINQSLLTDLYDAVEEAVDADAARFIVAYRMYGPNDPDPDPDPTDDGGQNDADGSNSQTPGGNQNQNSNQSPNQSSNQNSRNTGSQNTGSMTSAQASQLDQMAGNLSKAISGAQDGESVTRGGLDLSAGAQVEIKSLYELIDREVDVPANEEKGIEAETIASPWSSGGVVEDFPLLLDTFALTESSFVEGRVNVNEARREALVGLPRMTPQIADSIIAARASGGTAAPLDPDRRTTAWLVARGIVDLPAMRKLDAYLTGRGDVFKAHAVGYFDGGGPTARVEAVIDGTVTPARIVSFRDLTDLGRGYPQAQLSPAAGAP